MGTDFYQIIEVYFKKKPKFNSTNFSIAKNKT